LAFASVEIEGRVKKRRMRRIRETPN